MMDEEETESNVVKRGNSSTEFKVDKDTAEAEFQRFVDMMDLDIDVETLDDEDKEALKTNKRKILKALRRGSLVINDEGEPVFTPRVSARTEAITFYEPEGKSFMASDGKKKGHDIRKSYAIMADMTKTNVQTFSLMKNRDLDVCLAVINVFLG